MISKFFSINIVNSYIITIKFSYSIKLYFSLRLSIVKDSFLGDNLLNRFYGEKWGKWKI